MTTKDAEMLDQYNRENREDAEIRRVTAQLRASNDRIEAGRTRPTVPCRPRVEGRYSFVAEGRGK